MARHFRAAVALTVALTVAACSSSSASPSGTAGSAPASAAASEAPAPTASPTPLSGGVQPSESVAASQVAINPCTLLTDAEASDINGVSYGPGEVHPMSGGAVECVWQNAPSGSITLQLAIAADSATAQSAYTASLTDVQQAGAVTQVPGFADQAVIGRAPASVLNTGGIYVLDGKTFFDVVYLLGTTPSDDQLKYAATLVLGSLP
jgi:Protein of unknown function (DUF3558)